MAKLWRRVKRNIKLRKWKSGGALGVRGKGRWRINKRGQLVHMFKRQTTPVEITNSSTIGVAVSTDSNQLGLSATTFESTLTGGGAPYRFGGTMYFKLSNVLQSGDFTALYDRYKINAIKVKVIPLSNYAAVNGQGVIPTMVYHTDYDDSSTPTSDTDVRVKQGAKEVRLDRPKTIFFRPKVASMIAGEAGTAYSVPRKAPYINMSYPTAPHYGLKMFFRDVNLSSSTGSSINTCFRFETTYYLSMKDPQ